MDSFHCLAKSARKSKKMTQEELGRLLGVSGAYIAKIEKGSQCPSPVFIEKISETLELDVMDTFLLAQLESRYPDILRSQIVRR